MTAQFQVPTEKVPVADARAFLQIEDKTLALFNVAGQFYVIDDSYPHQSAHGLPFDLASGYMLSSTQLKVASYPFKVIDDQEFIILDAGE